MSTIPTAIGFQLKTGRESLFAAVALPQTSRFATALTARSGSRPLRRSIPQARNKIRSVFAITRAA